MPDRTDALPLAPDWAVQMLRLKPGNIHPNQGFFTSSPALLQIPQTLLLPKGEGHRWWTGEVVKSKPDGTVDRSATLYGIAGQLAQAGRRTDGPG